MYRIFYCLKDHHDWKLIILAALVCMLSSWVAVQIIERARHVKGAARLRWVVTAGVAGGFGVWATHFIAMLAYSPGVGVSYDLWLTILSLVSAMAITAGGVELAISRAFKGSAMLGGGVIGSGIASMHFLGMMAVDLPGHIAWAADLVVISILAGLILGAAAMWSLELKRYSQIVASLLLTLAIVSHHFIAMGAVTVEPDPLIAVSGVMLSSTSMSVTLAVSALAVLTLCVAAVRWGRQLDTFKADSDQRFRILLEGLEDCAIFMLDQQGLVLDWNAGGERNNGYRREDITGRNYGEVCAVDSDFPKRYREALTKAKFEGRAELEGPGRRADGKLFWGHTVLRALYDDAGQHIGFANVTQEITERKAAEDQMAEISKNLDAALSHMSQGLCLFDRNERLILANKRFGELYRLDGQYLQPGTSFRELLSAVIALRDGREPDEEILESFHARHRALIADPEGGIMISEFFAGRTMSISHRPVGDGGWVSTFDDITERRASEARLAHVQRHDDLTGLPNRTHFNDHFDAELARAVRRNEPIAVVTFDLDQFKTINDHHGHVIGDEALRALGERLRTLASSEGRFIARLGGDEFAAVKRFVDVENVRDCIQKLHDCVCASIHVDGVEIALSSSLGVAMFPDDGTTREALLNNADLALARAKDSLGEKICYYEASMDEAARDRRALAMDLERALKDEEFRLFYQVQQSVKTGDITGYEALIRWKHPVRGFVSPADFISIAEESGAIIDIGAWVLRTACREAVSWGNNLKIAVNLSPVQLNSTDLVDTVREILIETGLSPARLELEITESTIIDDKLRALHLLRQIKALGVTIAIDDFGTGYASLDTLNSFPFDKIKIDRSFLMEADKSPQARAIVRAILALGKSLQIPVLAEGVETEAQLELLREEGCDEAQGYLLGRPAEHIQGDDRKKASTAAA